MNVLICYSYMYMQEVNSNVPTGFRLVFVYYPIHFSYHWQTSSHKINLPHTQIRPMLAIFPQILREMHLSSLPRQEMTLVFGMIIFSSKWFVQSSEFTGIIITSQLFLCEMARLFLKALMCHLNCILKYWSNVASQFIILNNGQAWGLHWLTMSRAPFSLQS